MEKLQVWQFAVKFADFILGLLESLPSNKHFRLIGQMEAAASSIAQNNVSVYKGVTLEDDVFCGPSMVFTNVINPRSHIPRKHEFKETLVKKGATIGDNATILCGNTIGRYAFIGAGAVVTKDVLDYALMLGNPATIAGWMCECSHQIKFQDGIAICNDCGKQYRRTGEEIKRFKKPLP
ncbi:MAG: four helix bundle protein [Acidobacteriota bacterium]|nr:four helix bundle protein [Acidobacteriota bacterium]